MFYAHASKKCRQVFSFPGFPPMIALISVGGKKTIVLFLAYRKDQIGRKTIEFMKHAYGKSGGPRAEITQMRKPAHTKKVCRRNMTIILIPAYQRIDSLRKDGGDAFS